MKHKNNSLTFLITFHKPHMCMSSSASNTGRHTFFRILYTFIISNYKQLLEIWAQTCMLLGSVENDITDQNRDPILCYVSTIKVHFEAFIFKLRTETIAMLRIGNPWKLYFMFL